MTNVSPAFSSCSLLMGTPFTCVPNVLPASLTKTFPFVSRIRACCREMVGALMTRSHVGARPMSVCPSRSWCAPGIPASTKESVNNLLGVLALGNGFDGEASALLDCLDAAFGRARIEEAQHNERILRVLGPERYPLTIAADAQ